MQRHAVRDLDVPFISCCIILCVCLASWFGVNCENPGAEVSEFVSQSLSNCSVFAAANFDNALEHSLGGRLHKGSRNVSAEALVPTWTSADHAGCACSKWPSERCSGNFWGSDWLEVALELQPEGSGQGVCGTDRGWGSPPSMHDHSSLLLPPTCRPHIDTFHFS